MSKRTITKKQQTLFSYFKAQDQADAQPCEKETKCPNSNNLEMPFIENANDNKEQELKRPRIEIDVEDESENELVHKQSPKRKRIKKRIIVSSDDDDDDENLKQSTVEQCDIRDDLNFLDKADILQGRTRGKQVSRYAEALQKLKDRKSKLAQYDQGEKGPIESYSANLDTTSDSEAEDNDSSSAEEDFVVDDDMIDGEKTTAKKSEVKMPAEFSLGRVLSFKRQLEIYIEYLVQLVLNPVFDISSDTRYSMAKSAVTRRVQSYKDSMVTSDMWLSSFKEALDKYPVWHQSKNVIYDTAIKCEACRANKPASIEIELSLGVQKTRFYLGSECCRKGEMYHQFNHFSSHMYNKVKALVSKVRNKMMMSDRGVQESITIYNELLEAGYIKKLTRDVKTTFNITTSHYNQKGHRSRVEDTSSSSSEED